MKKRILFVDDEPKVLDALRRMLRGMRNELDMEFASGGAQALEMMEERPFDVVVTDMRMPGMDGCELLDLVKKRHPQTVRIVLSGHSDKEMILKSVDSAHQYLSKPCDPEMLKSTICRACSANTLLENKQLVDLISGIDKLPSMPTLYAEVMREANSPNGSLNKVGEIIANDVAMSAKILQLVNSSFFGLPKSVSNPVRAVSLLGLETVKALILSVKIFSQFPNLRAPGCSVKNLWEHSLHTGVFAKKIARAKNLEQNEIDESFTAGLLHDVGKLILMDKLPEKCRLIAAAIQSHHYCAWEAEQDVLGTTHASLGAYLMGIWGLSEPLVQAIAYHHFPSGSLGKDTGILTAVHIANRLEHERKRPSPDSPSARLDLAYLERTGDIVHVDEWREMCSSSDEREEQDR